MALTDVIQETNKVIHSDHPLLLLFNDTIDGLSAVWHYVLFKADNKPICVSNIIIGLILLIVGIRLAKSLSIIVRNKMLANPKFDKNTAVSLERIVHYCFLLIMAFFVLEITNVPLTTLTVVGTTLALGIGLGSQNIVNNFISGLIIMIEKPIKLGDTIEVQNIVGKVINIGARCVSIQTENNINMLVPNSNILQDHVINWTLNDPNLKLSIPLCVNNECSILTVDKIILEILHNNPKILKDPLPRILLIEIAEESLIFEIEFWINLDEDFDRKDIINELNRAIDPIFKEYDIKICDIPDYISSKQEKSVIKSVTAQIPGLL